MVLEVLGVGGRLLCVVGIRGVRCRRYTWVVRGRCRWSSGVLGVGGLQGVLGGRCRWYLGVIGVGGIRGTRCRWY